MDFLSIFYFFISSWGFVPRRTLHRPSSRRNAVANPPTPTAQNTFGHAVLLVYYLLRK